jgi:hypothetical protein
MRSKSCLSTQEARKLLGEGWILRETKCKWFHDYYVYNPMRPGMGGCAKFLNKEIFDNLKKAGFKSELIKASLG